MLEGQPRWRQNLVPLLLEANGSADDETCAALAAHLGLTEAEVTDIQGRLEDLTGPEMEEGCPALVGYPFIGLTPQLCVRCERCVKACAAIRDNPVMRVVPGRLRPVNSLAGDSWPAAGCTFCGACVDACVTGALAARHEALQEAAGYKPRTICSICDQACEMNVAVKDRKVVSTSMTEQSRAARICAVGRFAYSRMLNHPQRLTVPQVRREGELQEVDWDDALASIAADLGMYDRGQTVVVIGQRQTIENQIIYDQFASRVLKGQVLSTSGATRAAGLELLKMELRSGRVKAAIVAGDLLDSDALAHLEYLLVLDFLPSKATSVADAILPVAILAEKEGTIVTGTGGMARIRKVAEPPGQARAEWTILSELAAGMGATLSSGDADRPLVRCTDGGTRRPNPRECLADLPQTFRGHHLDKIVPALAWLVERNWS